MFLGTKPLFGIIFAIIALGGAGFVYSNGGLFNDGSLFSPSGWKPGGVHGAPGPLMGAAGLPMLVAYGVYRLVRRRRG
jgi:hypothetical protein